MRRLWGGSLLGRKWWILLVMAGALAVRWGAWDRTVNEDEAFFFVETTEAYRHQNPALQATGASPNAYFTSHRLFNVSEWLRATGHIRLVRLPFLLIGILACWFGLRLGRSMGDWLGGLLLAIALALWPYKAYADVEVRYYGLMLSLPVAQLWLLEAWRRNPTWGRMAGALALTFAACLTQVLSVVLVAAPWIYIAWKLPEGIVRMARRRRTASEYNRFMLRYAGQVLLVVLLTIAVLLGNRGRYWFKERMGLVPKPVATAKTDQNAAKTARTPGLREALGWTKATLAEAIAKRNAPRLLGLQNDPNFFWELLTGLGGKRDFKPGDWANAGLLLVLILGSVALILRSPPLAVSLWAVLIANGMLIDLNRQNYSILTTRYYTLAGLMIVMIAALGVGAILKFARWPVWRISHRGNAYATALIALIAGAFAFAALQGPVRARTQYYIQDWKGLYRDATKRFPLGAYYLGMAAHTQQLYNDLAAARFDERTPADYWTSPMRNRVEEAYNQMGLADIPLIEQLNPYSGLVVFNPSYWQNDYFPLREYHDFFTTQSLTLHGVKATLIPTGRNAFVTRGHLTMPVMPRFYESKSAGRVNYRLDCHYEEPGIYELVIGGPASAKLLEIKVDGEALQFETNELKPARSGYGFGDETEKGWAPARALPVNWKVRFETGTNPIVMQPAREYRIRFRAPTEFRKIQPIEMAWSDRLTTATPIASWSFKSREWIPATKSVSVGDVYSWSDAKGYCFSAPLRIGSPEKEVFEATLYLDDPSSKTVVATRRFPMIFSQRQFNAGDITCGQPLEVTNEQAKARLGKTLRLCLLCREGENVPNGWKLKPEEIVTPARKIGPGTFLIGYVKFAEKDGKIGIMFAERGM
ncbi:hypothetical protein LLG95_05970 [bacterium]|nr:hypothetical protein [bacterium]